MENYRALSYPRMISLLALAIAQAFTPTVIAAMRSDAEADQLAQQTVSQMTLLEKLDYIGGTADWDIKPLPRFGIPQIHGTDGGLGLRYTSQGNEQGVGYPSGPSLAATFNPYRALDFGLALGYDTASGGYHYVTGPGMNMYRMPFGGRNFEYLSGEDPYLGASLAPAVVNGIQARGVWADAKHYAANDQETNRFTLNETIRERVLREITLPPFESAVKNGLVALMMCSFQKVNGEYACENSHLIKQILKREWNYRGIMQTDYNAIMNGLNAAQAGTDLDMLAGSKMNAATLTPAIESGQLKVATIDDKVRRILREIYRFGFDTYVPPATHDTNSAGSNIAALSVAREGIVLLKNQNHLLPLNRNSIKKVAVIGVLGKYAPPTGFGSAYISPTHYISEVSGLRQVASATQVDFLDGLSLDPAAGVWLHTDTSGAPTAGMTAEYFTNPTFTGSPATTRTETRVNLDWDADSNLPTNGDTANTSIRWTGSVTPTVTGDHVFKVRADGAIRLTVNGTELINNGEGNPLPNNAIPPTIPVYAKISLQAGQSYDVKLEYSRRPGYIAALGGYTGVQMSWASLTAPPELAGYDAVVVAVGNSAEYEGEGWDHMWELPEFQGQLVQSVAQANPKTIVVVHGGTGLKMNDWVDQVGGLVYAFYPGQNGGQALAEILFGRANPSAKLPISLERNLQDNPVYSTFPQFDNLGTITETSYANDLFLGYRGYDRKSTKALYPFGFGLSYTTFSYSNLRVTPAVVAGSAPVRVSFDVTNTGQRAGAEISQLYVGPRNAPVSRPIKELKGYSKVMLQPGQTRHITLELNGRALAYYEPRDQAWVVDNDVFTVSIGASSQDIRLTAQLVSPFRQELPITASNPLSATALKPTVVTDMMPPTGFLYDQEVNTPKPADGDGAY
ncbi:glycoside hydrolase family 3 protein [Pseudomonas sp. NPDC087358]|uniref:beta-glucosidase n=1 Tax=Pseudomonas sp. NPDC087358 TaxID=3364439 RepID=UPI00384E0491